MNAKMGKNQFLKISKKYLLFIMSLSFEETNQSDQSEPESIKNKKFANSFQIKLSFYISFLSF